MDDLGRDEEKHTDLTAVNLVIDIGNTLAKAAVFDDWQIVEHFVFESAAAESFDMVFNKFKIEQAILSTTRNRDLDFERYVAGKCGKFMALDCSTPIPIENRYLTPETLGSDRLAAAVGAATLFPGRNVLVVDFGTAITLDVVSSEGAFLGGNISPGVRIRFQALNRNTDHLPIERLENTEILLGRSTKEAIECGVVNGVCYEIDGYIDRLSGIYDGLVTIFTGGDAKYFEKKLKNTIFAKLDLVNIGLNRILEYNETV